MVGGDAEGVRPALSRVTGINALATNFLIDQTTDVVRVTLGIMVAAVLLDAHAPEAGSVLGTVEAGRAGDAHSSDVIGALFGRLTGVGGIANLPGRTDALVAADDVDAVGATAARVPLQTLVDVLTAQVGVTVQDHRTNALHTGGTL